ncbi:MAG: YdeI/OmpD-associated family protein [Nitrospiria bacterium]
MRLRIFKKGSGQKTISYDEALDEALCFGWIDGQKQAHDDRSWIQKFSPRRAKSIWSKRNKEHIVRLVKERRMKPAGLKEVEAAKKDGRWDSAYDSPKNMKIPDDFLKELKRDKKAYAFFQTLNKANTYAIAWRLQTAKKPETRKKRMSEILAMMTQGKKFH